MSNYGDGDDVGDTADTMAEVPVKFKNLRACIRCSLVKSIDQFYENGCDNCNAYFGSDVFRDNAQKLTSAFYEGMIGVVNPRESWVTRWQRIDDCRPGMYAVEVIGTLPDELVKVCKDYDLIIKGKPPTK